MYSGISQYEITHMENLMVRDEWWDDDPVDVRSLCDIYECSECPRYGDDCDGDPDEEDDDFDDTVAYYERQGDEYVYYDENECELYREPA